LAEKKAALRTAGSFHKDPSSVSIADGLSAARTANNFRERHGEEVAAGWKRADGINQKYGIVQTKNSSSGSALATDQAEEQHGKVTSLAKKRPPPPPPPKKSVSPIVAASAVPPPPLPLATKPR
jgi:hypothetical protein